MKHMQVLRTSARLLPRQIVVTQSCHLSFQPPVPHNLIAMKEYQSSMQHSLDARHKKFDMQKLVSLNERYLQGEHSCLMELEELYASLPNLINFSTPTGDYSQAKQLYTHKEIDKKDFEVEDSIHLASSARDKELLISRRPGLKAKTKNWLNLLKAINTSASAGSRMLYFKSTLALLENALIEYGLKVLTSKGFALVSVPEVVPKAIVKGCGFTVDSQRAQIYEMAPDYDRANLDLCMSGTSEMSLAAFCAGRVMSDVSEDEDQHAALGLCAISKCYRKEVSNTESPLFRTHQFNKVEMFGITAPSVYLSDTMFNQVVKTQIQIATDLDLPFRVLELPSLELGNNAYRKVDLEAWMPSEKKYGEINSASNCTDYQSCRLNIRWQIEKGDEPEFAHTINGTAIAVPRLIKSILENYQQKDGTVIIPEVLRPYMNGMEVISKDDSYELIWLAKFN